MTPSHAVKMHVQLNISGIVLALFTILLAAQGESGNNNLELSEVNNSRNDSTSDSDRDSESGIAAAIIIPLCIVATVGVICALSIVCGRRQRRKNESNRAQARQNLRAQSHQVVNLGHTSISTSNDGFNTFIQVQHNDRTQPTVQCGGPVTNYGCNQIRSTEETGYQRFQEGSMPRLESTAASNGGFVPDLNIAAQNIPPPHPYGGENPPQIGRNNMDPAFVSSGETSVSPDPHLHERDQLRPPAYEDLPPSYQEVTQFTKPPKT